MLSPLAAIAGAPVEAQWDIPPWVDPGESFKGKVTLSESPDSDVSVHYEYVDARTGKVTAEPVEDKAGVFAFEIPDSGYADSDTLKLWLETRQGAQSAVQSVPLSQAFEFDITGDAAMRYTYDLEGLDGQAVFIPCCTIYSGILRSHLVDVNPVRVDTGLPANIRKPFIVLQPNHLVETTSGLHLELNFDEPPSPGMKPAVMSFNERTGEWAPIADPDVDEEAGTIQIACPGGGNFIFAWIE